MACSFPVVSLLVELLAKDTSARRTCVHTIPSALELRQWTQDFLNGNILSLIQVVFARVPGENVFRIISKSSC